jgi:hypothetical protein
MAEDAMWNKSPVNAAGASLGLRAVLDVTQDRATTDNAATDSKFSEKARVHLYLKVSHYLS